MGHFAGLDVSVKETSVCIVDGWWQVLDQFTVSGTANALAGTPMPSGSRQGSGQALGGRAARRRSDCGQGLVHDAPDGAGAPTALGAATQTVINFAGRTRTTFTGRERAAHVFVREYVTRTHDHGRTARGNWFVLQLTLAQPILRCKEKSLFISILSFDCGY